MCRESFKLVANIGAPVAAVSTSLFQYSSEFFRIIPVDNCCKCLGTRSANQPTQCLLDRLVFPSVCFEDSAKLL